MASIEKLEPGKYEIRWRTPEGKSHARLSVVAPSKGSR
jgi:hypothetical protein